MRYLARSSAPHLITGCCIQRQSAVLDNGKPYSMTENCLRFERRAFSFMKKIIPALSLCILLCCGCAASNASSSDQAANSNAPTAIPEQSSTPDPHAVPQNQNLDSETASQEQNGNSGTEAAPQVQNPNPGAEAASQVQNPNPGTEAAPQVQNPNPSTAPTSQTAADKEPGSAVSGPLSVSGTQLQDASQTPVQLRGISTHGLAWYPDYINAECFRQLKDEWGINAIRLAMYTAESGGYCTDGDQDYLKALVKSGVDYATDCGMYVIIDWHILSDGNPNTYLEEAKSFFQEMAAEYADHSNVLYEICNEPNGGTSWSDVKRYAEQVIAVIREKDPDGVILVGTPNWSQYVEQAAADPITDYDNIMYTLHFYAATHTDDLRDSMVRALEAGLPIFVSEFGVCDASGNGAIDIYQADKWIELLGTWEISYMAWNLSNKSESSALLKSSCNKTSGFTQDDLSDSGKWLFEKMTARNEDSVKENRQPSLNQADGNKNTENAATENGSDKNKNTDNNPLENDSSGNNNADSDTSNHDSAESSNTEYKTVQNDLEINLKIVNSWTQDNETYFQYDVTITNPTEAALESWSVQLSFHCDITLLNGWNGIYEAEGNTLTISSMDYNGSISPGGSVENIGFILYMPETAN